MFYDPERQAYVDSDTGAIVLVEDRTQSWQQEQEEFSVAQYAAVPATSFESPNPMAPEVDGRSNVETERNNPASFEVESANATLSPTPWVQCQQFLAPLHQYIPKAFTSVSDPPDEEPDVVALREATFSDSSTAPILPPSDDWSLARALQALEFEVPEDPYGNFADREYRASRSCRRQLMTISALICLVQVILMICAIQQGGYASRSENPVIGPPALTLVDYGAKQGGLIVYYNQWWRLFTSIMLHAGILHILPNVAIQMRVGGYLNLIFGTPKWLLIYVLSGIYGEVCSCIFLPNAVGVGSSGALMGMLAAWMVWIVLRWSKIPPECRGQRNCQLLVVTACIVITLATSFSPNVDWGAHFGGSLEGALLGATLLADNLENERYRGLLRYGSLMANVVLLTYSFYYVAVVLTPSHENLDYFLGNDDYAAYE